MAEEVSNLSGKLGIDTTDFKSQISSANREIRVLESSFKATAAGLQNWTKDATGLEARIKTLTSQIDLQKQKVAALAAEHQRMVQEEGANSAAAQNMEIRLNQATGVLNKMQAELRQDQQALEKTKTQSTLTTTAIAGLGAAAGLAAQGGLALLKGTATALIVELKGIAAVIKGELAVAFGVLKVGVGAIVGLGAAAVLAGALITGLTFKAAYAADQLGELADKTGISTTRLQELGFIGKVVGTDLDTIATANARLIRSMASAEKGTGAQADAFKTLGVRVKDASGNLRDNNVVMGEVFDALGKIQNPTERDALAMAIFGKSAQELNPLIKLGSKGMEEMADKAHRLGAIVSAETVKALGDLQDQLDMLKLGLQGVGTTILGAFAPFFSGMLQTATGYLEQLISVVQSSGGDFGNMAQGISVLVLSIVQDLVNAAPQFAQGALRLFESFLKTFIEALPDLLSAGRSLVVQLANAILLALPELGKSAEEILRQLSTKLIEVLPLLFTVGEQILLTLFNALITALPGQLDKMADVGLQIIDQLLKAVQTALPKLTELAPKVIKTLIGFLKDNLKQLIDVGIPLITTLIDAIVPELPLLVDAALQILIALTNGIAQQLPVLLPVIELVVAQIVEILAQNAPLLISAATALLQGLIEGFRAGAPQIFAMMPELINVLVQGALVSLGLLFVMGADMLGAAIEGFISGEGQWQPIIMDMLNGFLRATLANMKILWNVGVSIVEGIWQGIENQWNTLKSDVGGLFSGLIDWLKGLLGIASPSEVFGEIGQMSVLGFSNAFFAGLDDMKRQAAVAMRDLSGASMGGTLAGSSVSNSSEAFSFYAPVIFQGAQTQDSLAAKLRGRRY